MAMVDMPCLVRSSWLRSPLAVVATAAATGIEAPMAVKAEIAPFAAGVAFRSHFLFRSNLNSDKFMPNQIWHPL
jgi:hypothetical protein